MNCTRRGFFHRRCLKWGTVCANWSDRPVSIICTCNISLSAFDNAPIKLEEEPVTVVGDSTLLFTDLMSGRAFKHNYYIVIQYVQPKKPVWNYSSMLKLKEIYKIALNYCLESGKLQHKYFFSSTFFNMYWCAIFQFKRVENIYVTTISLDKTG